MSGSSTHSNPQKTEEAVLRAQEQTGWKSRAPVPKKPMVSVDVKQPASTNFSFNQLQPK